MIKTRIATRGFTLIELMIVVAIIGILASIAIPAFMKYIRRSKTTEALMNVRKLSDATVAYYESEHADATGNIVPRQWPVPPNSPTDPTLYPTPVGMNCTFTGTKYPPDVFNNPADPQSWQGSPVWQALNFGMDDPFYYSYEAVAVGGVLGTNVDDQYNVAARGDLNCNYDGSPPAPGGLSSMFRRTLKVDANYGLRGAAIYEENPLE